MNMNGKTYLPRLLVAFLFLVVIAALAFVQPLIDNGLVRTILACVFQALCLSIPCWALYKMVKVWFESLELDKHLQIKILIFTVVVAVGGILWFYFSFRNERDIKTYDSSLYWIRLLEDREAISGSIAEYLLSLRSSLSSEYNSLFVFPLILVSFLTGVEFTGFCASILLVYYLPAVFFLTVFALRLGRLNQDRAPTLGGYVIYFLICALCVTSLWPVLNGYMDVTGMLWMSILLNVILGFDLTAWRWKRSVAIGVLGLLLLLSRGNFEFYLVGFIVAFVLLPLLTLALRHALTREKMKGFLLNVLTMIGAMVLLALLVNPAIFTWLAQRDYVALYSVYKTKSLWANLWTFMENSGVLWLLLSLCGMYILLSRKKTQTVTLQMFLAAAISVLLLCLTRDLHVRDYYLLAPALCVFLCGFAAFAMQYARTQEKPIFVIFTLLICISNFGMAYVQPLAPYGAMSAPLTTTLSHHPARNPYYGVSRNIASDIKQMSGEETRLIYFIGDGLVNQEMINNAFLPQERSSDSTFLPVSAVDIRDGFPSQMFMADYVLVSTPFSSYFPTVQQVVFQAYDLVVNSELGKEHFELDGSYPAGGSTVSLYKKIKPVDRAFVDALSERLQGHYPDDPLVYTPNYFVALFSAGEGMEYAYHYYSGNFHLKKTEDTPVQFTLHDVGSFSKLSFELSCGEPELLLVVEDQSGALFEEPLSSTETTAYSFDISGSEYVSVRIIDAQPDLATESTIVLTYAQDSLI